jgi:hypothetical protein
VASVSKNVYPSQHVHTMRYMWYDIWYDWYDDTF